MSNETTKQKRSFDVASNIALGFLVSALSVLTATANYMAYQAGGESSGYEAEADRALARSNTLYLEANQNIIVDYTLYDGYIIQEGVDDFAAEYYQSQFSTSLQNSVDRESVWDETYYEEMYAEAQVAADEAFDLFDQANRESEREAGYQLSMLIAAVGLAFAAYASLLNEENRLRRTFAIVSYLLFAFSLWRFLVVLFT